MKTRFLITLCIFITNTNFAYSADQIKYASPDGKYQAYVLPVKNNRQKNVNESEIIIKTKDGRTFCSKGYGSEDGEHGLVVEKAAWTPDSGFFVYSMSSSGGHQPWHSPIYYVSVNDRKIRRLDDYIGAVTDSDFELIAPNTINTAGTSGDLEQAAPFKVSLSELVVHEKKQKLGK